LPWWDEHPAGTVGTLCAAVNTRITTLTVAAGAIAERVRRTETTAAKAALTIVGPHPACASAHARAAGAARTAEWRRPRAILCAVDDGGTRARRRHGKWH